MVKGVILVDYTDQGRRSIKDSPDRAEASKAEAAKLHCGSNVPDPAAYFRELVEQKLMKPPIVNGRSLQFDVRDFPASKRESMR